MDPNRLISPCFLFEEIWKHETPHVLSIHSKTAVQISAIYESPYCVLEVKHVTKHFNFFVDLSLYLIGCLVNKYISRGTDEETQEVFKLYRGTTLKRAYYFDRKTHFSKPNRMLGRATLGFSFKIRKYVY